MPEQSHGQTPRASWLLRIIALLLLLQAVMLVGLNAYNIYVHVVPVPDVWAKFDKIARSESGQVAPTPPEVIQAGQAVVAGVLLIPLAIPALVAAIGFVFLLRFSWILAMLTQVVALGFSLMLYLEFKSSLDFPIPWVIYPVMLYCICMVLYLNLADVRMTFRARSRNSR